MSFDPKDSLLREPKARKDEFAESARKILWKDRYDRKAGVSVDTAGAIARAMEQAYRLGLAHAKLSAPASLAVSERQDADAPVSWTHISPRARNVLESVLRFKWNVVQIDGKDEYSEPRWGCYWDWGDRRPPEKRVELAQSYSRITIAPLVKLGLMREELQAKRIGLVVTAKGIASWQQAIAQDQTLFRDAP
jgi:hypothetical protein